MEQTASRRLTAQTLLSTRDMAAKHWFFAKKSVALRTSPHAGGTRAMWWACVVTVACAAALPMLASAQDTRRPPRSLALESLGGSESYVFYCAPCHGKTGTGDGPMVAALRTRPADLTTLAERNGGVFPRERIEAYVIGTGRPIAAHGTSEMPVWGPAFRMLDGTDTRARIRVMAVVYHIESLQAGQNGASLFRTHCASCHGPDGRGGAAIATRKAPPDLTQYAMRNGGVFPSERLARIIDGRDVMSHLDREMPVWGRTFMRASKSDSDAQVKARIDALVRFLQSIQERKAE